MSDETTQPALPVSAGEQWAEDVMKLVARVEDDPMGELDRLLNNIPADESFFQAYDELLRHFRLLDSPAPAQEFAQRVDTEVHARIHREASYLKALVERMEARSRALLKFGVNSKDPLFTAESLGQVLVCPELGGALVVQAQFHPHHPLADVEPARLESGPVLVLGMSRTAKVWRKSVIRRNTDVVRIQRENAAEQARWDRERREAAERAAKDSTPEALEEKAVAALIEKKKRAE